MTAGAALVVLLGVAMFSQGWSLAGFSLYSLTPNMAQAAGAELAGQMENGVQVINSTLAPGRYPAITVQAGIPVKWVIDAPQGSINGCNNRLQIPEYGIKYQFQPGENIIEFLPESTGKFPYSCWMGMIRSSVTVVAAGGAPASGEENPEEAGADYASPLPAGVTIAGAEIYVAKITAGGDGAARQQALTEVSAGGFSPAVIVLQAGVETEWLIENNSARPGGETLLFPAYATQIPLQEGINPLNLFPTDSFDFSTADHAFYGYVKVVDDLDTADIAAIQSEVENYRPLIWPDQTFESGSGCGGACCSG
jgi:plastocyanin domain-containing protein